MNRIKLLKLNILICICFISFRCGFNKIENISNINESNYEVKINVKWNNLLIGLNYNDNIDGLISRSDTSIFCLESSTFRFVHDGKYYWFYYKPEKTLIKSKFRVRYGNDKLFGPLLLEKILRISELKSIGSCEEIRGESLKCVSFDSIYVYDKENTLSESVEYNSNGLPTHYESILSPNDRKVKLEDCKLDFTDYQLSLVSNCFDFNNIDIESSQVHSKFHNEINKLYQGFVGLDIFQTKYLDYQDEIIDIRSDSIKEKIM